MAKRKSVSAKKAAGKAITDEQAFLMQYDASRFPHPSVAVDVALLTVAEGQLKAVMQLRDEHPERGKWCLPGTFVGMDESLEATAQRVLAKKVGSQSIFLEQLYTFGSVNRDPRTRVITIAYYALVDVSKLNSTSPSNGNTQLLSLDVPWKGEAGGSVNVKHDGTKVPTAFDHGEILGMAVQRLRGKLNYAPLGFELLPREFTLRQLQTIHETILDKKQNKDSFRRRMLDGGMLVATGKLEENVGHRPAELYRFKRRKSAR